MLLFGFDGKYCVNANDVLGTIWGCVQQGAAESCVNKTTAVCRHQVNLTATDLQGWDSWGFLGGAGGGGGGGGGSLHFISSSSFLVGFFYADVVKKKWNSDQCPASCKPVRVDLSSVCSSVSHAHSTRGWIKRERERETQNIWRERGLGMEMCCRVVFSIFPSGILFVWWGVFWCQLDGTV